VTGDGRFFRAEEMGHQLVEGIPARGSEEEHGAEHLGKPFLFRADK
jgi:hypothetical protein